MTMRVDQILEQVKRTSKTSYDKNARQIAIKVDDLILFEDMAGHKLENLYKGLYKVVSIYDKGNWNYKLINYFLTAIYVFSSPTNI